ncbi:MAG: Calx-beta domain-containing protein, partial [Pseudomonadota bacterium]
VAGVDYEAVAGRLTIPAGATGAVVQVVVRADTEVEPDETLTLTLTNATNGTLSRSTAIGSIDNDDVVVPSLSVADAQVTEGDGSDATISFALSLSEATTVGVSVDYQTRDLSAVAGDDYVGITGQLTIPAGDVGASVAVSVSGDVAVEADETLELILSNPVNATLGRSTAIGTIRDNDVVVPELSVADAAVVEGNAGDSTLDFALTLSETTAVDVSVEYQTSNGTAVAGEDYVAVSGQATIVAGDLGTVVQVTVLGDADFEADETLEIRLTNPVNAALVRAVGVGNVLNDDVLVPTLSIADAVLTEGNDTDTAVTFALSLSEATSVDVSVDYQTVDE